MFNIILDQYSAKIQSPASNFVSLTKSIGEVVGSDDLLKLSYWCPRDRKTYDVENDEDYN
jgi:hypothetical protein